MSTETQNRTVTIRVTPRERELLAEVRQQEYPHGNLPLGSVVGMLAETYVGDADE